MWNGLVMDGSLFFSLSVAVFVFGILQPGIERMCTLLHCNRSSKHNILWDMACAYY